MLCSFSFFFCAHSKHQTFILLHFISLVCLFFLRSFFSFSVISHHRTEGRETKKRTTLARLLKGLKTVNRRDRTNNQNTQTQARVSKHIIFHQDFHHFLLVGEKLQQMSIRFSCDVENNNENKKSSCLARKHQLQFTSHFLFCSHVERSTQLLCVDGMIFVYITVFLIAFLLHHLRFGGKSVIQCPNLTTCHTTVHFQV